MADISITITADPNQAIQGIDKVKNASKELVDTSTQVNKALESNSISVSRQAETSATEVISVAGKIGNAIKGVTTDATKISGALGSSIPAVGKLGSAIQSVAKGPLGLLIAGVTSVVALINKMLDEVEARTARLQAAAAGKTSRAYDALMEGRKEYAEQLKILDQVKQINALARESGLSTNELASFRRLASQIGISERDVQARGINPNVMGRAEAQMQHYRSFYSQEEYNNYINSLTDQFKMAIDKANISDKAKKELRGMSIFSAADVLSRRSRPEYGSPIRDVPDVISNSLHSITSPLGKLGLPVLGNPSTDEERKAYEELYNILKPLAEVRKSYNADPMLGRTQEAINDELFRDIQAGVRERQDATKKGSGTGTWTGGSRGYTWRDMDRDALAAAKKELEERERRAAAGEAITAGMKQEIEIQGLINDGKKREAAILKDVIRMEETLGRSLTAQEKESIEGLSGHLYDLRNIEPMKEPAPIKIRGQEYSVPLDRLQRIGANVSTPVASAERMALDKQVSLQQNILDVLKGNLPGLNSAASSRDGMRFP